MFIKITNDGPKTYTIGQLRQDNSNVSFPKEIPLETLAEYNVYPCTVAKKPDYNNLTEDTVLNTPTEVNGAWIQSYSVVRKSQEDAERNIREQRNFLLSDSDWTQVADAPVNQLTWANYRQALRDITTQEGFPFNVTFPSKPE